jgi:putative transposase
LVSGICKHPSRRLVSQGSSGRAAKVIWGRAGENSSITCEIEQLIARMASENREWGDDRIVGASANLGYEISDQHSVLSQR